jgi:sulfite reductase alpha subunit-like flavoprotein
LIRRPRRSILEVLQDFPTVRLPWKWVCAFFPVIRGRKYSICSGGVLRNSDQSQYHKIQIIVAIVKYRTVLKKIRQGLCSRYLASLDEGSYLRVGLDDNPDFTKISICEEPERPIIFVAPGTGVAPCRSLIWERAELSQENDVKVGPCYLFFGGRNQNADYFYKDEWNMKELQVTVFTAFSRDQKEKIYVQDIIRKEGQLITDLLTANILPVIYVCGSSGNMPKAVRAAIVDAVLQHSEEMDRDKCEKQLAMMEKNGLYIQETW